jgi:hypothetical protein
MTNTPITKSSRGEFSLKPLTDWDYFVRLVLSDSHNTLTVEEAYKRIEEFGKIFYELWIGDRRIGAAFALCEKGFFTLDGYNEEHGTEAMYAAVWAGKKVCQEIFDYHQVNEIWTCHHTVKKSVTALALRIGFKRYMNSNDKVILRMVRYGA